MGTPTYDPIQTVLLGSPAASVTFSSIPATWTDLILVCNPISASGNIWVRLNGDTAANYSRTWLYGDGTSAVSNRVASETLAYLSPSVLTATSLMLETHFLSYANTSINKTLLTRFNDTGTTTGIDVNLWQSTAAINSILITAGGFGTGTKFTLFGIKAA